MNVGIGLALLCAAVTQLGFLCKHRGAAVAPRVELRAPLRSAKDLFRSRWFAIGMAIAAVAFALHVAALAVAPLSVVQVSLSTGVVMLAVMGERLFGCKVGSRQWIGVIMTATGLMLLVLTLPRTGGDHSAFAVPALIAFQAGMLALGVLLIAAPRLGTPAHHHGAILGAAAGTLFGVSDVAVKALTSVDGPLELLTSPWLLVAGSPPCSPSSPPPAASRRARPSRSSPAPSTAANITVITGGIVVFGDALAGGVLLLVQILAFALVAVAALVTPHGRPVTA